MADPGMTKTLTPVVELTEANLPAFCLNPSMPVWNHHPRVFLELGPQGEAMCPYCGTRYRLKPGSRPGQGSH